MRLNENYWSFKWKQCLRNCGMDEQFINSFATPKNFEYSWSIGDLTNKSFKLRYHCFSLKTIKQYINLAYAPSHSLKFYFSTNINISFYRSVYICWKSVPYWVSLFSGFKEKKNFCQTTINFKSNSRITKMSVLNNDNFIIIPYKTLFLEWL